jgi:N-methylhydantoinase A
VKREKLAQGDADSEVPVLARQSVFMDGDTYEANIYDRAKLKSGNRIEGPAIITEMDSTSVILVGHAGVIDDFGNIIIRPLSGA